MFISVWFPPPPLAVVFASGVEWDAVTVFFLASAISGLSGLACLLRTDPTFTTWRAVAVVLNCALLGLGLSMVWLSYFEDHPNILVGICILLGLGGTPMLDFVLNLLKNGGLSISLKDGQLNIDKPKVDKTEKKETES